MALEQIGLEAVLQDANFQAGLKRYISGLSQAEGQTNKAASGMSALGHTLSTAVGSALGFLTAQAIPAVIGGLQSMAGEALTAYADYERLGMSLESLMAREIMQQSVTTKTVQVGTAHAQMTAKQKEELDKLQDSLPKMNAQLAVNKERLAEATEKGKESSAELELRRQNILALEGKITDANNRIAQLTATESKLVPVMKTVTEGGMTMTDAMKQASPAAQNLIKWVTQLAVISPFKQEDIAAALQLAMGFGFTSKESKQLVTDIVDFAAATGKSGEVVQRMILSLGQMRSAGKLSGAELRELAMAGLPVKQILAKELGKSTAEIEKMIEKGVIPAEQAFKILSKSIETDFGGAAQKQAGTFSGLLSSLEDLKTIGLREFFAGTFKAIQPYVADFVNMFSDPKFMASISDIGAAIGLNVTGAIKTVIDLVTKLQGAFQKGGVSGLAGALGVPPEVTATLLTIAEVVGDVGKALQKTVSEILPLWAEAWANVNDAMAEMGISWKDVIGTTLKVVGAMIIALIAIFAGMTKAVATTAKTSTALFKTLSKDFKAIIEGIAKFFANWIEAFKKLFAGDFAGALKNATTAIIAFYDTLQKTFAAAIKAVTGPLTIIINAVGAFADGVLSFFKNLSKQLVGSSIIPDMMRKMQNIIDDTLDSIADFISGILDSIIGLFESWGNSIVSAVRDAWNEIENAIESAANSVASTIQSWIANIESAVQAGFGNLVNVVAGAWQSIMDGVSYAWETITSAIGEAISSIPDAIAGAVEGLAMIGYEIVNSIWEGLVSMWSGEGGIVDTISALISAIPEAVSGAWSAVAGMGAAFVDALIQGVADNWQTFIDTIWEWIEDWLVPGSIPRVLQRQVSGLQATGGMMADMMAEGFNRRMGDLGYGARMGGQTMNSYSTANTNISYNLYVTSAVPVSTVAQDFGLMRALSNA